MLNLILVLTAVCGYISSYVVDYRKCWFLHIKINSEIWLSVYVCEILLVFILRNSFIYSVKSFSQ